MFSPIKAITAGSIVFAIGGAFLIAQPFGQQGSVPGAAMDPAPAPPVEVTATSSAGPCPGEPTTEAVGDVTQSRGGYCNPHWSFSDERLNGTVTWSASQDEYLDSGVTVGTLAISIENDGGGWRMRPRPFIESPRYGDSSGGTWVLDGEGDYEGLVAVLLEVEPYTLHGFIIDGELPPPPENASTK